MLRQSIRNVNDVYTIDVSNWLSKHAGTTFMTRECECIMTGEMNKGRPTIRRSKSDLLYSRVEIFLQLSPLFDLNVQLNTYFRPKRLI